MKNKRDLLDKFMEDNLFYEDLPGLAIKIHMGKDSPFEKAVGYANFATKAPLSVDHAFHMGSVSKLFTATSILQLVEKGLLSLEDKLPELLPWLNIEDARSREITLHQLLTHTSGLGDVSDYHWEAPEIDEGALRRYVESEEVVKGRLLWDPGTGGFAYSNMGYEMLGCIVAEKSGLSFETYVAENILKPLEMNNSTFLTHERTLGLPEIVELMSESGSSASGINQIDFDFNRKLLSLDKLEKVGMAMPHVKNSEKKICLVEDYPYNRRHGPSSTLSSTVLDLSKFAQANLACFRAEGPKDSEAKNEGISGYNKPQLLRPETYELLKKPFALIPNNGEHISYSWFIREQQGYTLYGHEGTDDGFRASFWLCPRLDLSITVLSNLSKAPVKKIGIKALDLILKS